MTITKLIFNNHGEICFLNYQTNQNVLGSCIALVDARYVCSYQIDLLSKIFITSVKQEKSGKCFSIFCQPMSLGVVNIQKEVVTLNMCFFCSHLCFQPLGRSTFLFVSGSSLCQKRSSGQLELQSHGKLMGRQLVRSGQRYFIYLLIYSFGRGRTEKGTWI